jgi:hypothetical protein
MQTMPFQSHVVFISLLRESTPSNLLASPAVQAYCLGPSQRYL